MVNYPAAKQKPRHVGPRADRGFQARRRVEHTGPKFGTSLASPYWTGGSTWTRTTIGWRPSGSVFTPSPYRTTCAVGWGHCGSRGLAFSKKCGSTARSTRSNEFTLTR